MAEHVVRVSGGKYTFVNVPGTIRIDRHGEPWVDQVNATNATHSMMCELDAARVVVCAARRLIDETTRGGYPVPSELKRVLELHGRLVDDHEEPSEWCGPSHKEPF